MAYFVVRISIVSDKDLDYNLKSSFSEVIVTEISQHIAAIPNAAIFGTISTIWSTYGFGQNAPDMVIDIPNIRYLGEEVHELLERIMAGFAKYILSLPEDFSILITDMETGEHLHYGVIPGLKK